MRVRDREQLSPSTRFSAATAGSRDLRSGWAARWDLQPSHSRTVRKYASHDAAAPSPMAMPKTSMPRSLSRAIARAASSTRSSGSVTSMSDGSASVITKTRRRKARHRSSSAPAWRNAAPSRVERPASSPASRLRAAGPNGSSKSLTRVSPTRSRPSEAKARSATGSCVASSASPSSETAKRSISSTLASRSTPKRR